MTHKVELNWKGQMLFESVTPEGNVLIDAAKDVGGLGKGVRPKAMMLSSLAGCTGMDIILLLKKMRAEVAEFKIEVSANLTDEHPKYYNRVHLIYRFYGSEFKKDKIKKAVNLSVERYCGVFEMFRKFSDITHEIQYIAQ